jgi:hypothetical protein
MKVLSWTIALLGLWEFADIAAIFVPSFGTIPGFLWNHIIAGFLLMLAGARAARTHSARTARSMHWTAAGAGLWLVISSFILRSPLVPVGLANDLIVGVMAFILGAWSALVSRRETG